MSPSSKIEITSNLEVQNEYLHETLTDPSTGEVKFTDVQDEQVPRNKSTTIASNPVKYEAKGVDEPRVTEGEAVDLNPATVGCDTSQL
jgi:predicted double-glycine peptidase